MLVTEITNYQQQTVELLLQQYKSPVRFNALLAALIAQIQQLEYAIFSLNAGRTLAGSVGQQLDNLGTLFNVSRNGLTDDQYRVFIQGAITEDNSDTTITTILNAAVLLFQPHSVLLFENFPAEIELDVSGITLPSNLWPLVFPILQASLGGGINLGSVIETDETNAFRFTDTSGALSPGTGGGFADATNSSAGGGLLGNVLYSGV